MINDRLDMFTQRYQNRETPWDTGITPPEIMEIAAELTPGKALDLGCGTGTNVRYLLEQGWEADGIDFVPQAVDMARANLDSFPPEQYALYCHDVTLLNRCTGLRAPYDLVIDIGCGHGIAPDKQAQYAQDIAALLSAGGTFTLYAHQPTEDRALGWTPDDVRRIFSVYFEIVWQVLSVDTRIGVPSGWYRMAKLV